MTQTAPYCVRHVVVQDTDAGMRLDKFVRMHAQGAPPSLIHKWIRTGQIRINGARAKSEVLLVEGQDVRLPPFTPPPPGPRVSEKDTAFMRRLVVWEDESALVLAKPTGLAVQGGTGTKRHVDGLLSALAGPEGQEPHLVHRLDKDTSGTLLIAKTPAAARALGAAFKAGEVEKLYWALVAPAPTMESGSIKAPLEKGGGPAREKMRVRDEGQKARTDFKVLSRIGSVVALVAFAPRTGRTHQIRAHAAHMGCPILGDTKYGGLRFLPGMGGGESPPLQGIALHARRIRAPHPTKKGVFIDVTAPLPRALLALFKVIGLEGEGSVWDALLPR